MEWQPIETAPRDGREIVLLLRGDGPLSYGFDIGFWCVGEFCYSGSGLPIEECRPTHWLPIPEPPTPVTSEEG